MDDDTREQSARTLADEAARAEAHEAGAFAAEAVRQSYGDDFIAAREPAQQAYNQTWKDTFNATSEFYEPAMMALLAAYDAEKHPASVTAEALADAVLETSDPNHTIDAVIAAGARLRLIQLAERVIAAFPAAHEPN